jgi:serine/threonine protein kinase
MMLAPGARVGTFEVIEPLGAGGMGEVYRARDARLGRDVALKVLPQHVARDAQRLARFEREARVLAALNHPNIATLYGIDDSTGAPALVLEFVPGQTLADRLAAGALSLEEALSIAGQIAAALEGAHERGVIHRDLKPANIALCLDGGVKVLDFGLAKALEPTQTSDGYSATITANAPPGTVMGTPAYMSPEQARGLPADKRTDIWAFGCVLYEMLTGRRAFGGERASDVVAKIIEREPDLDALPAATPPAVRKLLRRCLEKDPKQRLRDIADARFDLEDEDSTPVLRAAAPGRYRPASAAAIMGAALLAIAAAAAWWTRREPGSDSPVLFTMTAPAQHVLDGAPTPSPAGDRLVFVATSSTGESSLWLRPLDSPVARRIAGTEGAIRPFWSPDGRSIGFGARGSLKRVDPDGGPVYVIAPLSIPFTGATWNGDGVIVFAPSNRAPLHRVPAAGGAPEPVTALDAARGENSHRFPHFLPDGRHFLFTARAAVRENTGVYVGSLDSKEVKRLLSVLSPAVYAPSGHLLFVRDGALLAQRFDAKALELSGDVQAIYGDVAHQTQGAAAAFATSADGRVLAWGVEVPREFTWFDRSGAKLGAVGPSATYEQLRLSPDGKRAAVVRHDDDTGNRDIWVVDLDSGALARLTSDPANDWFPVWSPDGAELLYASDRHDKPSFYRTSAAGAAGDALVFQSDPRLREVFPTDWSTDGEHAVFHAFPQTRSTGGGIWLLPLRGAPRPAELIRGPYTEWIGSLSPDGQWLAFMSDESGVDEVYVQSTSTAQRFRISMDGGSQPRWRRDGRELFFVSADNRLMSTAVDVADGFAHSPPRTLFAGCGARPAPWEYHYDVSADGERSLWLCPVNGGASAATVAINWGSKLARER